MKLLLDEMAEQKDIKSSCHCTDIGSRRIDVATAMPLRVQVPNLPNSMQPEYVQAALANGGYGDAAREMPQMVADGGSPQEPSRAASRVPRPRGQMHLPVDKSGVKARGRHKPQEAIENIIGGALHLLPYDSKGLGA